MTTIALIGPDGAGKTTLARRLLAESPLPFEYLYMGLSIESSNVALPTSRLAHRFKVSQHKRSLRRAGKPVPAVVALHGIEHRSDRRGKLGAVARLARRVSEEGYRQLVSWVYQWRGRVVLYDRHFLFDSLPPPDEWGRSRRLTDRIHHWFLHRLYPRPGLVVLLDAPAEVLYARKPEVPLEYLEAERAALKARLAYARHSVTVDASRTLDEVYRDVEIAISHQLGTARG